MYELETLLNIAVMNEFIPEVTYTDISSKIDECIKLVNGLIGYYEKSNLK